MPSRYTYCHTYCHVPFCGGRNKFRLSDLGRTLPSVLPLQSAPRTPALILIKFSKGQPREKFLCAVVFTNRRPRDSALNQFLSRARKMHCNGNPLYAGCSLQFYFKVRNLRFRKFPPGKNCPLKERVLWTFDRKNGEYQMTNGDLSLI